MTTESADAAAGAEKIQRRAVLIGVALSFVGWLALNYFLLSLMYNDPGNIRKGPLFEFSDRAHTIDNLRFLLSTLLLFVVGPGCAALLATRREGWLACKINGILFLTTPWIALLLGGGR